MRAASYRAPESRRLVAFPIFFEGGRIPNPCRIPQSPLESAFSGVYNLLRNGLKRAASCRAI